MEKVVVATGQYPLSNDDMREVNQYLAGGWSVKSVTPQNTKDHMTVIFVLERERSTSLAGTYNSNPMWNGRRDYLTLNENGTYTGSFYGGVEGTWKAEGDTLILSTHDGRPDQKYTISHDRMSVEIGGRLFSVM